MSSQSGSGSSYNRTMLWLAAAAVVIALVTGYITYQTYVNPQPPKNESTTTERTPYIMRVDNLCLAASQELHAHEPWPQGPEAYAFYMDLAVNTFDRLAMSWGQVTPPELDQNRIRAVLNDLRSMMVEMRETANATRRNDIAEVDDLRAETRKLGNSLRGATTQYGFRVCNQLFAT